MLSGYLQSITLKVFSNSSKSNILVHLLTTFITDLYQDILGTLAFKM